MKTKYRGAGITQTDRKLFFFTKIVFTRKYTFEIENLVKKLMITDSQELW